MLDNPDYQEYILLKLNKNLKLQNVIKLLTLLSKRFLFARPNTFDSPKCTLLYDRQLLRANESAVNDRAHDVDVVMESYQREI